MEADTELIKNIITGGSKSFTVSDAGAWYRLGYAEKAGDFFGEFLCLIIGTIMSNISKY